MNGQELTQAASFAVALLSFATVVYNAGRYGERMTRHEKNISDFRMELDALPAKFVSREVWNQDMEARREVIKEFKDSNRMVNDALNIIMVKLGRLEQHNEEAHS